jgi:hypothetical protein
MVKNPYRISKEFHDKTDNFIRDEIDDFYIKYIDHIGGVENFTDLDSIDIRHMYIARYLEYKDGTIDYRDN